MRRSTPWPARGCWAGMGPRCRWWTWPTCSTYRPLASREWPWWSGTATGSWAGASTRSRAKASWWSRTSAASSARSPAVPGATIDADGTVVCLLDLRELADRATDSTGHREVERSGDPDDGRVTATTAATSRPRILVVEDSIGVRELERVILEGAGYAVETAVDGLDGASRLGPEPADLVLSDVEMPGMDGFALTRTIRRTGGWEQVPVVIMTSRGADTDRHLLPATGTPDGARQRETVHAGHLDVGEHQVGRL